MTEENDQEQHTEDEWQKEFESLYQNIRQDKRTLKKEPENLNQILTDLKAEK